MSDSGCASLCACCTLLVFLEAIIGVIVGCNPHTPGGCALYTKIHANAVSGYVGNQTCCNWTDATCKECARTCTQPCYPIYVNYTYRNSETCFIQSATQYTEPLAHMYLNQTLAYPQIIWLTPKRQCVAQLTDKTLFLWVISVIILSLYAVGLCVYGMSQLSGSGSCCDMTCLRPYSVDFNYMSRIRQRTRAHSFPSDLSDEDLADLVESLPSIRTKSHKHRRAYIKRVLHVKTANTNKPEQTSNITVELTDIVTNESRV